jgi:hypothetical protein
MIHVPRIFHFFPVCDAVHCNQDAPRQIRHAQERGTSGNTAAFLNEANTKEAQMPVFVMWGVPAVIVIGGVSYYLIRAVH